MTPIEKVRAALKKIRDEMPETDDDYYDGWAHDYHLVAQEALAELEGMAIVPIEPDKLPKGFTQLDYAELIAPYVPEEKK